MSTESDYKNLPRLRYAYLCVNAQDGQEPARVEVLQQFEKTVRIRAIKPVTLGGRKRHIQRGETALVPAWTVKNAAPPSVKKAARKRAAATAPLKFYCYQMETVHGIKTRFYNGKTEGAARAKAIKVADVIRVSAFWPVSEVQYLKGLETFGQK